MWQRRLGEWGGNWRRGNLAAIALNAGGAGAVGGGEPVSSRRFHKPGCGATRDTRMSISTDSGGAALPAIPITVSGRRNVIVASAVLVIIVGSAVVFSA